MNSQLNDQINSNININKTIENDPLVANINDIGKTKRRRNTATKMLKTFERNKVNHPRLSMTGLAKTEKDQTSKEVRFIFKSDSLMSNNIKSLLKEKKINDTIVALISFIMIIMCFYQLYLLIDAEYYLTDKILTIRTCIVILSVPNYIRKYNLKLKESNFMTSGMIKYYLIEILFNTIQPFPYLEYKFKIPNGSIEVECSLAHLSTLFMALRLYLIYKLLNHYNMWTNTRSKRIGNLLGFEPNSIFATKVMLSSSPIFLLSFISFLFIIILGLLIRAFEYYDIINAQKDFEFLWNALWLNFVTMSTVGYGDYFPKTNFGKIFCVISCLFGIFLLSMFVAVITLLILLDTDEYKAFHKLNEKEVIYTEMKNEIVNLFDIVGIMYKYKKFTKIDKLDRNEIDLQRLLVKVRTHQLNQRKKLLGITEESTEDLLKQFENHLDCDMAECMKIALNIVHCEKKFYAIANKQIEIEELSSASKSLANRTSNLANLMRILSTCGKINQIDDLEGGRLYNYKTLTKFYIRYFANLRYKRRTEFAKCSRRTVNTNQIIRSNSNK